MAEAILVLKEIPKNCQACPLKSRVMGLANVTHCCNLAEGMITLDEGFEKRLDNCPLKELPKAKPVYNTDKYNDGWCDGYNKCLDDIKR